MNDSRENLPNSLFPYSEEKELRTQESVQYTPRGRYFGSHIVKIPIIKPPTILKTNTNSDKANKGRMCPKERDPHNVIDNALHGNSNFELNEMSITPSRTR